MRRNDLGLALLAALLVGCHVYVPFAATGARWATYPSDDEIDAHDGRLDAAGQRLRLATIAERGCRRLGRVTGVSQGPMASAGRAPLIEGFAGRSAEGAMISFRNLAGDAGADLAMVDADAVYVINHRSFYYVFGRAFRCGGPGPSRGPAGLSPR